MTDRELPPPPKGKRIKTDDERALQPQEREDADIEFVDEDDDVPDVPQVVPKLPPLKG